MKYTYLYTVKFGVNINNNTKNIVVHNVINLGNYNSAKILE